MYDKTLSCSFSLEEHDHPTIVVIAENDDCDYFPLYKLIDEEILLFVYDDEIDGPSLFESMSREEAERPVKRLQRLLTSLKAATCKIEIELQSAY